GHQLHHRPGVHVHRTGTLIRADALVGMALAGIHASRRAGRDGDDCRLEIAHSSFAMGRITCRPVAEETMFLRIPLVVFLLLLPLAGKETRSQPANQDLHGDPLPKGAVARIGTIRWRHEADRLLFSADGKYVASSGNEVRLWEVKSGKWLRSFPGPVAFLSFPKNGTTLVTAGFVKGDVVIIAWDIESGQERRRIIVPLEDTFQCAWSADGKFLACIHFGIQKKMVAVA